MKIVIVEDEIRIREGLMKLLERIDQNYQVVGEAENGKAGLELILESKPDLVITDVQMPIMDGLEMLRCLQEKQPFACQALKSCWRLFGIFRAILERACSMIRKKLKNPICALSGLLSMWRKNWIYPGILP